MKALNHVSRRNAIWGWHFVGADMRLSRDARNVTVAPGYVYTYQGESPQHCEDSEGRGLFACRSAYDALGYANGPVICRVRSWGDVIERGDKLVSRHREVIAMANVDSEMRLFACWCVRQVWPLLTDKRSRRVIEIVEAFTHGKATLEELDAARIAAGDAAGDVQVGTQATAWGAWAAGKRDAWRAAWDAPRLVGTRAQRAEFERRMFAAVEMQP